MKKYFDKPFKDKHSHLPYGDLNGPPGQSLHIYLPIIQELNHPIYQEITEFLEFIVDICPNTNNLGWKNIQESQIARRQRDWRIIIANNFIILSYSFLLES